MICINLFPLYLLSATSFPGMCDGGLEEGIVAATRDDTTINAHDVVSLIFFVFAIFFYYFFTIFFFTKVLIASYILLSGVVNKYQLYFA